MDPVAETVDLTQAAAIDPAAIFTSYDPYVTIVAVVMIVTLIKHTLKLANPALMDKAAVKILLEWSAPVLGGLSALLPGLWDAYDIQVAVLLAAFCGFIAERAYKSVLKRMLPGNMLVTSESRTAEPAPEREAGA